jgi:hypothetical protein
MICIDCQTDLPDRLILSGRCHACAQAALTRAQHTVHVAATTLRELNAAKHAEAERIAAQRDALLRRSGHLEHHG